MSWLDELDAALVGDAQSAAAERRLDALIDQGIALLGGAAPEGAERVDAATLERVQGRLRAIADLVAEELDHVRGQRRELTRATRAHRGYRALAIAS